MIKESISENSGFDVDNRMVGNSREKSGLIEEIKFNFDWVTFFITFFDFYHFLEKSKESELLWIIEEIMISFIIELISHIQ